MRHYIRIGPTTWTLEFVDHIAGGNTSEVAYWEGKILMANEAPRGRWLPLVVHEILETLNFQYGDALNLEHFQINVLAEALAQVIRDNLELFLYLASLDGAQEESTEEVDE